LDRIRQALYEQYREQAQREASPAAAIIDSQSVKSAEQATVLPVKWMTCNGRP
jgi:putative transposase